MVFVDEWARIIVDFRLSTYINDLIAAGFTVERLEEPLSGADATRAELFAEVPTVLVVAARAT
jgi:hypothetical protein